jgi:hypothetical protein
MATPLGSRRATRCASSTRCEGKGRARKRSAADPRHLVGRVAVGAARLKCPRRDRERAVEEINGTGGGSPCMSEDSGRFSSHGPPVAPFYAALRNPTPHTGADKAGALRARHAGPCPAAPNPGASGRCRPEDRQRRGGIPRGVESCRVEPVPDPTVQPVRARVATVRRGASTREGEYHGVIRPPARPDLRVDPAAS